MMEKLSSQMENMSHPVQDTLTTLGSSFSDSLLHLQRVREILQVLLLLSDFTINNPVDHNPKLTHSLMCKINV